MTAAPQQGKAKRLGVTAYAVLGLLSLRDWTTYELAQQMERGIGRMWSAAPSMVYEDPKHLVAAGYATVRREHTGRRPRAVYSITAAGRTALAAWLAEPGQPPQLQFEALLKILFADAGTTADLLATLRELGAWAEQSLSEAAQRGAEYQAGAYLNGTVDFESRGPLVALALAFLSDFYHFLQEWQAWAAERTVLGHNPSEVFAAVSTGRRVVPNPAAH